MAEGTPMSDGYTGTKSGALRQLAAGHSLELLLQIVAIQWKMEGYWEVIGELSNGATFSS